MIGYHRYKRNKSSERKEFSESPKTNTLKSVTTIAANIAQVATLAAVIWGYYNTVLPVFQKEVIAEELAKIQSEKKLWNQKLGSYKSEVKEYQDQLTQLNDQKRHYQNSLAELKSKVLLTQESLVSEQQQLKELQVSSQKLAKNLVSSEKYLYDLLLYSYVGDMPLPKSVVAVLQMNYEGRLFEKENPKGLATRLQNRFIQPLDMAKQDLNELRSDSVRKSIVSPQVYARFVSAFEKGLQQNKNNLLCPEPNYSSWETSFTESFNYDKELISACAQERIKLTPSLKNESYYINECKFIFDYSVERLFQDRWRDVNKSCDKVRKSISRRVLNVNATPVVFTSVEPPSKLEINSHLRAVNKT
ncbi:hypothetical protein P7M56_25525 [Vibrio parahaemolyticus]|nr:hypothetical protein [Vibrio parahaemolyticus]MDG2648160.1 hypothetical protein [Vibrio parahaemolyticus]